MLWWLGYPELTHLLNRGWSAFLIKIKNTDLCCYLRIFKQSKNIMDIHTDFSRWLVSYSTDLKNLEVAQATNCCSEAIEIHGLSYFRPMTSLPNGGATKQFIYFLSSYLDAKSVVLKYIRGLHKENFLFRDLHSKKTPIHTANLSSEFDILIQFFLEKSLNESYGLTH